MCVAQGAAGSYHKSLNKGNKLVSNKTSQNDDKMKKEFSQKFDNHAPMTSLMQKLCENSFISREEKWIKLSMFLQSEATSWYFGTLLR